MKIAVLLPDLRPGGAERMRVQMAGQWVRQGIAVEFVLRQVKGELLAILPDGATSVDLRAKRVRNALLPLVRYLGEANPNALLAAMWPMTVIAPLAARMAGFSGRVVVSEHAPQSLSYAHRGWLHGLFMRRSMALGYRQADACIGVSGGIADDMAVLSGLPRTRFTVVHNPAALGDVACKTLSRPEPLQGVAGPLILSVGTLKAVKRHDLLVEAFARLPMELGAKLCILGEGSERVALEEQVAALGLSGRVLLPGFAADTAPWYAHADLFVLSSDYEGFGNVLVEALEQGVPVVSTDCPSGPREILADGRYGTLVPVNAPDALAAAMLESLGKRHDRGALRARARDFSVDKAADAYLDLLLPGWRTGNH